MKKTKLLLLAALLMIAGAAKADVATDDKVVISSLTVVPGSSEAYSFTVSLEGTIKYTAYQIDLQLPEGLEPAYNSKGQLRVSMVKPSLYPYSLEDEEDEDSDKSYTHTLSCALNEGNTLRVATFSSLNECFTKTSGDLFKVYVTTTPYLKPGDVEIKVKNVRFVTPDETKYLPEDYVSTAVQATATSTLTLKVSETNKFGTCILPFDYALPADGSLEAYTCSNHTADALLLEKADKIAAYTPYILYSENGFSATISGEVDATKYPADGIVKNGHLVGTVVQTELTEATSYVMQNQGSGVKFYQVDPASPFVLAAGKCYVELPEGTASPSFRIGGTTDIENSEFRIQNSELIYNVLGQRVDRMTSGHVYIVNGRKVIK